MMISAVVDHQHRRLSALLGQPLAAEFDVAVSGLVMDSRAVARGDLFVACRGQQHDARTYIEQAVGSGAAAVLAERGERWQQSHQLQGVPVVVVDELAAQLSAIAGRFYAQPSQRLKLLGVTGTNGKTSCTHLLVQLLNQLGQRCGLIGTLGTGVDLQIEAGINTTPDALSIQRLLAQWSEQQIRYAAMEVSSHGLSQQRVAALQFDSAIFTNLSRDHLDYHGSMQAYADSKAQLFMQPGLSRAVLNADDPFSQQLLARLPAGVRALTYSVQTPSADIWVRDLRCSRAGIAAQLHSIWGSAELYCPLWGAFNLGNLLAVIAVLAEQGFALEAIVSALATLQAVPGRMERIRVDGMAGDIDVLVDYAHTPDALEKALQAMRAHVPGRLWLVFGCGGDRDRGKRPMMGEIAERLADQVILTSDNPRSEQPAAIVADIQAGATKSMSVELDRAQAIALAIAQAKPGDSVLIAGKGHEDYQLLAGRKLPFSDSAQARLALRARGQS